MTELPFCSIVIPALNEEEFIEKSLYSLNQQTYPRDRYEIIVVDNGSHDRTMELASKFADKVLQKTNTNVGGVRNYGAQHAKGEIIICTDSDCIVNNNWIETGVTLLNKYSKSVFGGGLKPRDNASWVERYWLLNDDGHSIGQTDLMGSCIFARKEDFDIIGKFDDSVTSGEDSDLSARFKVGGFDVIMSGELSLVHLGSPTTVKAFTQRQVWHSENYAKNLMKSLSDKTFILTLFYLIGSASTLICIGSGISLAFPILLTQLCAGVLSIKRIKRSRKFMFSPLAIIKVLALDNLYLIGRSLGFIKGLFGTISKTSSL